MEKKFNVDGMSCSACEAKLTKGIKQLPGIKLVEVNLLNKSMYCEFENNQITEENIIEEVSKLGFSASLENQTVKKSNSQQTSIKTRLIVSLTLLIILMYLTMGPMINLPLPSIFQGTENTLTFALTQFMLSLPIVYVNRKYYDIGFKNLIQRSPNMDTLVAVSSAAAIISGIISLYLIGYGLGHQQLELVIHQRHNLFFESGTMILALVTLGKYLEERSKQHTTDSLNNLLKLQPKGAIVLRDGKEVTVVYEKLKVNDLILVKPGEAIAVDGIIVKGTTSVNESMVTGESLPVSKQIDDLVIGGTINNEGTIQIKAQKVGQDTILANIIKMVEKASATKAPIAKLADKVAGIFVPVVMSISLIMTIVWLIAGYDIYFSISIGIAVLVISCPCALGLATPVAITVGTGNLANKGILVKNAEILENLAKVDTVVFDKTGTITTGEFAITAIDTKEDQQELLQIVASIETLSQHPLAKAIVQANKKPLLEVSDFKSIAGKGVVGTVNNSTYYIGNAALMNELNQVVNINSLGSKMFVAKNKQIIGEITLADQIKPEAKNVIEQLEKLQIKTVLLTGDNQIIANDIANKVNINEVIAEVLPDEKAKIISKLQQEGKVCMVGDGVNDAIALTLADVGMAIGQGSDVAIDSGDVVLMNNEITTVYQAISYAKKVLLNIKENLFCAFFYNVIAIPVAMGLFYPLFQIKLSPMIGAACMSLSSIFVTLNALRLKNK